MNETDQLALSRYVDGDLSPLERKKVEAMLDADPVARRMVAEYSRMRQYVKELPKEPLNHDLVPLLRESLARKRRFSTIPVRTQAIAGVLAASVLIATFSIAYFSLPGENLEVLVLHSGPRGPGSGSAPSPSISSEPPLKIRAESNSPFEGPNETAETSEPAATPEISLALSQSATSGGHRLSGQMAEKKVPAEIDERFRRFLKATEATDRKHAFRLHVSSASERQIDSVLSLIGRFRSPESSVLERRMIGEDKKMRLSYVALIPTGRMADFRAALRSLPGIEMEQDKPDAILEKDDENSKVSRFVEPEEISRAIDNVELRNPEPASDAATAPVKRSNPEDDVPDAIRQPLKVDSADVAPGGTLDEVIIWIRTDPLRVDEGRPPTRPE